MNEPIKADSYGELLRYWRKQRGVNQTELALECDTSSRHLSCVETERAQPSRHLLLRLCAALEVPLRARNSILISAGYAPLYRETGLSDPEMEQARGLLQNILKSNEPNPTMLLDRNMDVVMRNQGMERFFNFYLVDPELLKEEPPNLLRLVLHPQGLASRILNIDYVHLTMVERARRSLLTGAPDQRLRDILQEVMQYAPEDKPVEDAHLGHLVMPLEIEKDGRRMTIATTSATLGSSLNVTLQELFIETAYPMDEESTANLAALTRD